MSNAEVTFIDKWLKTREAWQKSAITDDPAEWEYHDEPGYEVWQNWKNSEAFSYDGGKTYIIISENYVPPQGHPVHISAHKDT